MIDLNEKRQDIITVATEIFEKFVNMSEDVRPDDKKRTGIQVLVWEPGTRNLVMVSVGEPSEAARFFAIEKAVRTVEWFDMSSGNSADPEHMKFAGSVLVYAEDFPDISSEDEDCLVASVSGLKAEEDVAISVAILANLIGDSFCNVCKSIDTGGGNLPEWFSSENKSYFQFLFE